MRWLPDYALPTLKRYARFIEQQCQQQPPQILKSEFYKQLQTHAKAAPPVGVYGNGFEFGPRGLQEHEAGLIGSVAAPMRVKDGVVVLGTHDCLRVMMVTRSAC